MLGALLIFGPQRLPDIGRGLGRTITEFRRGFQGLSDTVTGELQDAPPSQTPAPVAHAPAAPTAPASGNFCIQCGSPNPAEARFCGQCGAALPS